MAGKLKSDQELKVVIVGDGSCGKSSLLMVFANGRFPEKYAPSVFEKHVTTITHGGRNITLNIIDTAGQDDYDRLRPLSYQEADLILVCYDVTNHTSFDNVMIKWHPEVKHFCKDVPVVLVGCKTDLRKDQERLGKLKALDQTPITYTQGEEVRQQMNAELYLECSAKHQENVHNVFLETTKKVLDARSKARKRRRKCVVM
ncbi:hypothetical protein CRUP_013177 [Coryphaenoides rupestris]|nr:hypothetical protein CRUP_013177 [Coryphaenoides rupestris]